MRDKCIVCKVELIDYRSRTHLGDLCQLCDFELTTRKREWLDSIIVNKMKAERDDEEFKRQFKENFGVSKKQ